MMLITNDDYLVNLERVNFFNWFLMATPLDLEVARKNNGEKFDKLMQKYKEEVKLLSIIK